MGRNEIKVYCTNLYFKAHKKKLYPVTYNNKPNIPG